MQFHAGDNARGPRATCSCIFHQQPQKPLTTTKIRQHTHQTSNPHCTAISQPNQTKKKQNSSFSPLSSATVSDFLKKISKPPFFFLRSISLSDIAQQILN